MGKGGEKKNRDQQEPGKKPELKSSLRTAPLIEAAGPQAAKRQTVKRPNLQVQGRLLEMQIRIKAKEAKRKIQEAETAQLPNKKRCDREERIAEVQLKAYWKCYPLPTCGKQPEDIPLEDTSEDELIEIECDEARSKLGKGNIDESDQELIPDAAEAPQSTTLPDQKSKGLQNGKKFYRLVPTRGRSC